MDIFSHALLPFFLGSFFKIKRKLIAGFVLGAIAPDLDLLVVWINYIHPTSLLLVHRGFTHTFFFGFFAVLAVLYLASRNRIKTVIKRFADFEIDLSWATIALAYVGLISHLFLDFLTTRGAPLFYPWIWTRYSAEIFYYIEIPILIVSLLILAELYRKNRAIDSSTTGSSKNLFLIFLIFFLVVGAIRIEGKETAENLFATESAKIYPDSGLFQWIVLEDDEGLFRVTEFNSLYKEKQNSSAFSGIFIPSDTKGFKSAFERAELLPQVKLFRWRAYAVAINASHQNGSWYLEYFDPVVKTQTVNFGPIMRKASKSFGSILIKVEGEKAAPV